MHLTACAMKSQEARKSSRSEKLFAGLSTKEIQGIVKFMKGRNALTLVNASTATVRDNYIYTIENHLPNKAEVTDWLDRKSSRQPTRMARVVVFMGKTRKVMDFLVWPIPNPTSMNETYTNRKNMKALSWKSRPICNVVEAADIQSFVVEELTDKVSELFFSSFTKGDCFNITECMYANMAPRAVLNSPDRHIIMWFFVPPHYVADYYVYALPFYIVMRVPQDGYDYEIVAVYYNSIKFDSLNELKDRYYANKNIRYKLPDLEKSRGLYGSPEYVTNGQQTADQTQQPPRQHYPDGARFTVAGQHVQWLGWEFDIHSRTTTGLQIFDVRYNSERIAYELSMQDIVVLYSGNAPDDFFKNYFDNGWSIGRYNLPLVRGVDCPSGAVYLNSSIYAPGEDRGIVLNDAICVFEHRNAVPMRRHYSTKFFEWGYRFAFSMPDSVLIVRQIITVWNYDYVFDYEFHQNGMVEVKVSSTGYIAVTPNIGSSTTGRGYVVNSDWDATANLHQHLFNFRLDLDVAGTENNFKTLNIGHERVTTDYSGSKPWYQMTVQDHEITQESQSALKYEFDSPKQYVIYNKNEKVHKDSSLNRGYRIQSNGFSKLVLPDDSPLLQGASWAKYQVAVTKFDNNERGIASAFVQGDPFEPAVNIEDFLANNDDLDNVDLVAWVTVGIHHLPTYEDLPVTTTPGKTLSISLAPFNFFERDPSMHSRDAAVFWSKSLNLADQHFFQNDTCLATSQPPTLNVS